MKVTEEFLLKNGVSRETLDECLKQGSVQQPLPPFVEYDVTFGPIEKRDNTLWITIEGWRPCSTNEMAKGVKTKIRLKKRDRAVLCEASRLAGPMVKASGKRRLSLIIRYPKGAKRHDPDAFFKSTLDAAKHAGLIVNDSPVWLELGRCDYDPQRGPIRTVLILENL